MSKHREEERKDDAFSGVMDRIYSLQLGDLELNEIKDNLILAASPLHLDTTVMNAKLFSNLFLTLFLVMQDRLDDLDGHRLEISTLNGAYTSSRELLNSSVQDHLRYEAIWLEEKETLEASVIQLKRKVRILESRLTSRIEHVESESIPNSGVKAAEGHHVVSSANSYTQTCDRADVQEDSQVPVPDSKIKELSAKLEKVESLYGNACASLVRQDELFLQNEQNFLTNLNEANLHRCDLLKRTDSLQAELRILRVELDGLEHEKVNLNGIIEDIMARVELGNSYPNRRKDPPGPPESGGSPIEDGRRRIHGVPNVLLLGDSFLYRLSEEVRSLLPSKFSVTSQMMTDAPLSVLLSSLPPESSRPEYIVLSAGAVDVAYNELKRFKHDLLKLCLSGTKSKLILIKAPFNHLLPQWSIVNSTTFKLNKFMCLLSKKFSFVKFIDTCFIDESMIHLRSFEPYYGYCGRRILGEQIRRCILSFGPTISTPVLSSKGPSETKQS
ncbi:hypothetical protein GE061_002388 [Apolygus lucorum]|uniref:Uncharacterized protein n=1 Tax=Apolygus lucorum TaxID=248454 RepID=A0A8S9X6Q8_APOLU|nr:hypothetical protein GE061_002388 [Apolygus lucorum]